MDFHCHIKVETENVNFRFGCLLSSAEEAKRLDLFCKAITIHFLHIILNPLMHQNLNMFFVSTATCLKLRGGVAEKHDPESEY